MKRVFAIISLLSLALVGSAFAKDHSNDYKVGTFISATAVADGTITSTLHGDGTTVAGDVYANHVGLYTVKVADGSWTLESRSQAADSMIRNWGMTPTHFKSEKANPLDVLKNGERVLFRVEQKKKIGGTETDVFIPYADKPDKEFAFVGTFHPDVVPQQGQKPTDNVKALCDSHKLSAELEKQYCTAPTTIPTTSEETTVAPQGIDLTQLAGERVKVMRIPLCQPGTYTVNRTYAGKQATVLSARKSAALVPLSSSILDKMPPASRAMVEDFYASATLLLRFDDGVELDTCAPISPRNFSDSMELVEEAKQ